MSNKPVLDWDSPQALTDIRAICPPQLTETEFNTFINTCRSMNLNPFTKEIYCLKNGTSAMQIIVARDGYRKVAQREAEYDYHQTDAVYSNDKFKVIHGEVEHEYELTDRGRIIGAYCTVKRKSSSKSMYAYVEFKEYDLKRSLWTSKPATMIKKCFDFETEVLTDLGFQRFDSVTGNVLQITKENGLEKTDSIPFSQDYEGEMIQYDGQYLNFSVTPTHNMILDDGQMDAEELFNKSNKCYRDAKRIPSNFSTNKENYNLISDEQLKLAAYYICDGTHTGHRQFRISVSRDYKINALDKLNLHAKKTLKKGRGRCAIAPVRKIITNKDYQYYSYDFSLIEELCFKDKTINPEVLLKLSQRQTKIFVNALVEFDGYISNTNTKRFYTSRLDILKQTELAAIHAGYAVNVPTVRISDLSTKPNYILVISEKTNYPVVSHMEKKPGIKKINNNASGKVWCVTVPSGMIVVRRNGFSMVCGNCAEAHALRMAFQAVFVGTYDQDELPEEMTEQTSPKSPMITEEQVTKIDELMMLGDISYERIQDGIKKIYHKSELYELTLAQATQFIQRLEKKIANELNKGTDTNMEVKPANETTEKGNDTE